MSHHPLESLFAPRSIAVVGASERRDSVGEVVFSNLRSGFSGELHPVNHARSSVQGVPCVKRVSDVGRPVDLAVIAVPAPAVPGVLRDCAQARVETAAILSSGFAEAGEAGARLQSEALSIARSGGIRLLGPNSLGFVRPSRGVNAIFSRARTRSGRLALLSQSGAVCSAIIDWAEERAIGFSTVVSLGAAADVGFGDVLDYVALDPETDAVLLYMEGVDHARRFMSGLRLAARMHPVIVLKAGRKPSGAAAAFSHTAALIGDDAVFDSALRRAGVVRARTLEGLFSAAELLSRGRKTEGDRLAIVTNAGGLGVMAADRAEDLSLRLAALAPATLARLDAALPAQWSHRNPVDLVGDAPPARYDAALAAVLGDPAVDGVVVLLSPQAMTRPEVVASHVIEHAGRTPKPVLACLLGGAQVAAARRALDAQRVPQFQTPEDAVEAFAELAAFERHQRLLLETPGPRSDKRLPDVEGARRIVQAALASGRQVLTLVEAKALLHAFHVPVTQSVRAHSADEAVVVAESFGMPVAMKVDATALSHKSDVGGVRLGLRSAGEVRAAFGSLMEVIARHAPDDRTACITLEPMHDKRHGRELLVGVAHDPAFGPVIACGAGGTLVELLGREEIALPPLNRLLAHELVERSAVRPLLGPLRGMPEVDRDALEAVLLRVSELVCELPEVRELDINPLVVDETSAVAVDARVLLQANAPTARPYAHVAIEPFPSHLVHSVVLADGTTVTVRPIRPEDAEMEQGFVRGLSLQSRYFRFRSGLVDLTPRMLVRMTQIDYDREMAFIAVVERDGIDVELGVARYVENPDGESCEFALAVADAYQGKGLGSSLMAALIARARERGLRRMEGEVLPENDKMLDLMAHLGFTLGPHPDDPSLRLGVLAL